jgi:SAM-dependent methyltransferase
VATIPERAQIPPPDGSPEDLAALRRLLGDLGYLEPRVCERLGLGSIFEFQAKRPVFSDVLESPLDVLIRLFIGTLPVDESVAASMLPPGALDLLRRVGLLRADGCAPAAMLYPVRGVWVASDTAMWRGDDPGSADLVFAAMSAVTGEYLAALPPTPCEAFLELCGGTGVAALAAAREGAVHAWSGDITERSTRFALFNTRLNGFENVTCLQGNMYGPVEGLTFDRIAAHPPYVPASTTTYIFRDGGEDGEELVRAAIAGAPGYLRPGGRFYLTGLLNEREGQRAEQRVRKMLGDAHAQFDVGLVTIRMMIPSEFCLLEAVKGRTSAEDATRQERRLVDLGVTNLVYGWVVIQRHDTPREFFTARRQGNPRARWQEVEWLMDTEALWADQSRCDELYASTPLPGTNVDCFVTRRYGDSGWKATGCTMRADYPFHVEITGPPWLSQMCTLCDGSRTVAEVVDRLVQDKLIEAAPPRTEFLRFLRPFATAGLFRFL